MSCGWDAGDHQDYLRIRTKHGNKTYTLAFVQELMRAVPGLDDSKIKEHVAQYERYLELTEQKRQLLAAYKEAKKRQQAQRVGKVDTQNALYSRLNSDLELLMGEDGKENVSKNGGGGTEQERKERKEMLEQWKRDKQEGKQKEQEDKKRKEDMAKAMLQGKLEEERRVKREQVEDFKFRKEMDRQRERQLEEMEKRKQQQTLLSQEQRERIFKREEELFFKKHQ